MLSQVIGQLCLHLVYWAWVEYTLVNDKVAKGDPDTVSHTYFKKNYCVMYIEGKSSNLSSCVLKVSEKSWGFIKKKNNSQVMSNARGKSHLTLARTCKLKNHICLSVKLYFTTQFWPRSHVINTLFATFE